MIEIGLLAGTLVSSFLIPMIKMGAEKLVEKFSSDLGADAAKQTSEIVGKLGDRIKGALSSPQGKTTMEMIEQHPDAAKPMAEVLLKDALEKDPALKADLENLWEQLNSATDGRANSYIATINIGNDNFKGVKGDISITGNSVSTGTSG